MKLILTCTYSLFSYYFDFLLSFLLHYFCKILELLLCTVSNEQLMSYTVKFEIQPNLCNLSFYGRGKFDV